MTNVDLTNKFDFNDLLIVPEKTTRINSRYKDVHLPENLPILTAPMDTVINMDNANLFTSSGIGVIIPRTNIRGWLDYMEHIDVINENNYFVSLGFEMFEELIKHKNMEYSCFDIFSHEHSIELKLTFPKRVLLDIANGHIEKILTLSKDLKKIDKNIEIMVGSVANPETYRWYAESGCVDYVRVGIGAGNGCLTTKNSGVGYPMASLIYECRLIKKELMNGQTKLPAIVADGGMKDYADIIKALGLGADYVLLGSILNKCLESAGDNYLWKIKINPKTAKFLYKNGFKIKKHFRGMSTKEAQIAMGKTNLKTSEGVVRYRPVEYTLCGWVENFNHYLRNILSYTDSRTLDEFIGEANFCKITEHAYKRFDK